MIHLLSEHSRSSVGISDFYTISNTKKDKRCVLCRRVAVSRMQKKSQWSVPSGRLLQGLSNERKKENLLWAADSNTAQSGVTKSHYLPLAQGVYPGSSIFHGQLSTLLRKPCHFCGCLSRGKQESKCRLKSDLIIPFKGDSSMTKTLW